MEYLTVNTTLLLSQESLQNNFSPITNYSEFRSSAEIEIEVFLAAMCGFLAAVGNGLLIIAIRTQPYLRQRNINRLMESLAWTDVITAFIVIPSFCVSLAKGEWVFGETFCNVKAFLLALTTFATLDTLTVIALSRLLQVVFNKTYRKILGSPKKTDIAIGLVWLVSTISAGAPIIGWGAYAYLPCFYVCTLEWHPRNRDYLVFVNILSTYPATVFIIACYICISVYYRKKRRRVLFSCNTKSKGTRVVRSHLAEVRVMRMTGAVVVFYLICWFPIAVMLNLKQYGVPVSRRAPVLSPFLKFVNSCGNPIFYVIMDGRIRKTFLRIVRLNRCATEEVQQLNINTRAHVKMVTV